MKDRISKQLVALTNTLDREEKTAILQYLQSPYHNQRKELLVLMQIILDYRSSKASIENRIEALYKESAGGKISKWRLINSDLLKLLETFLMDRHPSSTSIITRQLDLRKLLRERRQPLRQAALDRRLKKQLSALPEGVTSSRINYQVAWEELTELLSTRRLTAENANSVQEAHERACLLEALQLACESLSARTIDSGSLRSGLLPLYLNYLESGDLLQKDRVIALYYYCYRTMERLENEMAFEKLRERLNDDDLDLLDNREATDILFMAINACIRRVNSNRPAFGEIALDLYDIGLEKGYLLDSQGLLSRFTYSNIIALALKADNPERASLFIGRFSKLLPSAYAQSTEALNRARLSYHENQLEQAMDWLQTAKDQDLLTTLNIRILQMRVYYQLGEFRLLDAHLDALDIFLRRRKDSLDYHYRAYRNLVGLMRKFRRLNTYDKAAVAQFREKVITTEGLPERGWLLRIAEG